MKCFSICITRFKRTRTCAASDSKRHCGTTGTMNHQAAVNLIQSRWCRYQMRVFTKAKQDIRDRCRCCVCHDECVDVMTCANGHSVCVGCDALIDGRACPLCRDVRGDRIDTTLATVASNMCLAMHCEQCGANIPSRDVEFHRAWCAAHPFQCPVEGCTAFVHGCDMCQHVTSQHSPYRGTRITMAISRFSSNAVCIVGGTTVVISCTPESRGDTLALHTMMHIRAYYPSPECAPLLATVTQKRATDLSTDTFLERFHLGVVPPVIASRERLVLSPYSVAVTPRCIMTNETVSILGRPPMWLPNPVDDVVRLGIRDIPIQTRPQRTREMNGVPVAIVTITFATDKDGSLIGDIYDS